jgi:hypothetical protein
MEAEPFALKTFLKSYLPCIKKILFVCLLVYSRLSNFSSIRRLSPLPVTGLQI